MPAVMIKLKILKIKKPKYFRNQDYKVRIVKVLLKNGLMAGLLGVIFDF